jgi:putative transposase
MSVRDIVHHLRQVYGTDLSAETVSRITDAVLQEVRAWQDRPLDPVYAAVFLDAIVVKVRDNHAVHNKPAYLAIGADGDGEKHVPASGWPGPPWTRRPPRKEPGSGRR